MRDSCDVKNYIITLDGNKTLPIIVLAAASFLYFLFVELIVLLKKFFVSVLWVRVSESTPLLRMWKPFSRIKLTYIR